MEDPPVGKPGCGRFLCYTLEDGYRKVKVPGETRIPGGKYEIRFRKVGTHHKRYAAGFSDIHKGMLELQDVPGFKYILVHVGNYPRDTSGCILVGSIAGDGIVSNSTNAYRAIYPAIAGALEAGEKVFITVVDYDTPPEKT